MTRPELDYGDVQGLVRFGYKRMTEAAYLLLRVRDAAAARAWLRSAPVTSATTLDPPPTTALQVAFTASGLKALGVAESTLAGFSSEFLAGMTADARARRLGDVGANAPSQWEWGAASAVPHLAVMLFAEPGRDGGLDGFERRTTSGTAWSSAFEVLRRLDTGDLGGHEPFGFADGLSQPEIDWEQRRDPPKAQINYDNVVALGEFLLGYPNEYRKFTDRPILAESAETAQLLPAQDAPGKRDLGRNGTYLVARQLRQDVRKFWQFISREAGANIADVDHLAAAFVGRTTAGDPLVPIRAHAIAGIGRTPDDVRLNQFTFDDDPAGARCPIGAHIRRANPRNADLPGHPTGLARLIAMLGIARRRYGDDLTSSVRFHRILRRGREYGPGLSPADALAPAPANDPERGLHFLCLNANISRQFEFLQNSWVMGTKFAGLTGESDPLLGNRLPVPGGAATSNFTRPLRGSIRRRVEGIPQFVTVRGGAYFFLPSLRAIRYFAAD
jgi:deferrochelatase/peroxidase EfeB